MSLLGTLYYGSLHYSGLAAALRNTRAGATILCYHNVVPTDAEARCGEAGLHMPVTEFQHQMEWLVARYRVVPLQTVVEAAIRGEALTRTAAVTFDDGYNGVFDCALPVTRRLGIPVTLFIVGGAPGGEPFWWDRPAVVAAATEARRVRWLEDCAGSSDAIFRDVGPSGADTTGIPESHYPATWDRIDGANSDDVTIGAHTLTHRHLTSLSGKELRKELVEGVDRISESLGIRPNYLSYPYGAWSPEVRQAAKDTGYEAAVTLDDRLNTRGVDPLALRRTNVPTGLPLEVFEAWTLGMRPRW